MTRRRSPLVLASAVVLIATGLAAHYASSSNPTTLPNGLGASANAESTALYCTGLPSAGPRPGRVDFVNTASVGRSLALSIVSDQGRPVTKAYELAGHATLSVQPSTLTRGTVFGVAAQVNGGGVVGEEIAGNNRAEAPCAPVGVTKWYATGFDTLVGSNAEISVYNPTATNAVLNATLYSAAGVAKPAAFQGLSIRAHAEVEINLGKAIVNTSNVGVAINVLRGSLAIVGVQDSNGTLSFNPGTTALSTTSWLPDATTVQSATAQVRVANPSARVADVSVAVDLGSYHVAVQHATIDPYSTGLVSITPNSAVPADGYANLTVRANVPIFAALATGNGSYLSLAPAQAPSSLVLVRNFSSLGFDTVSATNTSSRTLTLSVTTLDPTSSSKVSVVGDVHVEAGATISLTSVVKGVTLGDDTYLVGASSDALVVGLTLPGSPKGASVVSPLNGG